MPATRPVAGRPIGAETDGRPNPVPRRSAHCRLARQVSDRYRGQIESAVVNKALPERASRRDRNCSADGEPVTAARRICRQQHCPEDERPIAPSHAQPASAEPGRTVVKL